MDIDHIITDPDTRLAWRQHLVHTAINEDMYDEEADDRSDDERQGFLVGATMTIANATFLTTESTSDVEAEVYERIKDSRQARLNANVIQEAEALLERWKIETMKGGTRRGFAEWAADRE